MSSDLARVVLVDDDHSFRQIMSYELERMGFDVTAFPDATGLAAHVGADSPDAVILDLRMPGADGMATLEALLEVDPDIQIIVLTGHGSVAEAVQAMRRGALDFLTKPVPLDILEQTLRRAVQTSALIAENRRLRRLFAAGGVEPPVLTSEASRRLEQQIQRIGASENSVLVLGESGVGKELAARALHAGSARASGPFVTVNCGAIPAQLMESELFGHRKGAFTGADRARAGLFEAAHRGTLFLDEVGELPLELQPALLRAIQFGEIRPVGSDAVRVVDIRLVAATNQDLRQMSLEGRFREDLYFRLAVLELEIPPLRERRADIAVLANHFLARETSRANRHLVLTPEAEEVLVEADWPGNVRQLENAMVRIAVLAAGPTVEADEVRQLTSTGRDRVRPSAELPTLALRELEYLAIEAALAKHGGNKPLAAQDLGIALKTLYNKLNRQGPH